MAMFDLSLLFCTEKEFKTAFQTDAIDCRQESPTTGANASPFYLVLSFPTAGAGTGSVSFTLQDSADGSTGWRDVVGFTGAVAELTPSGPMALAMPVKHRRYVRLSVAPASGASITAGKVTAFINENYTLLPTARREGSEWYADNSITA